MADAERCKAKSLDSLIQSPIFAIVVVFGESHSYGTKREAGERLNVATFENRSGAAPQL
jgi:hypothetical protein